jgi:hypothetical protein
MREFKVATLILLFFGPALAQTVPQGWKVVKDAKGVCRMAVPAEWALMDETSGAAVFQATTTAIAVVTSQPEQAFKPLPENLIKLLGIRKDRMFENTVKRLFYQDRVSRNADDPNAYSASVPGKSGTCSCRVTWVPSVTEDVAKKIALSLGPLGE